MGLLALSARNSLLTRPTFLKILEKYRTGESWAMVRSGSWLDRFLSTFLNPFSRVVRHVSYLVNDVEVDRWVCFHICPLYAFWTNIRLCSGQERSKFHAWFICGAWFTWIFWYLLKYQYIYFWCLLCKWLLWEYLDIQYTLLEFKCGISLV